MTSIVHGGLSGLRPAHPVTGGLKHKTLAALRTWVQRSRSREELARMSDFDLRDIGLSRVDVSAEITKPFWRA